MLKDCYVPYHYHIDYCNLSTLCWRSAFTANKVRRYADLQVLRRYLAQTTEDIAQAHKIGSPVDNNML